MRQPSSGEQPATDRSGVPDATSDAEGPMQSTGAVNRSPVQMPVEARIETVGASQRSLR